MALILAGIVYNMIILFGTTKQSAVRRRVPYRMAGAGLVPSPSVPDTSTTGGRLPAVAIWDVVTLCQHAFLGWHSRWALYDCADCDALWVY